ncbi:MAG: class I SAM-dependent methyltransferase [Fodinibius sp.]|nr:class I SAM-dependent methyltransferase [Fodinibius sp.]
MSRFSQQSDLYAQYRPNYPDELYAFIFDHLRNRNCAWDCATGSGQVAQVLAGQFKTVMATDISAEQMSHAPEIKNVTYQQVPAENPGFADDQFDLITIGQALHWFNIDQFYHQVRRVAANDALLAAFGYGMLRINEAVNPIIDHLYEEAFGSYYNKNRSYIDNAYQSIPFPFDEVPSPDFEHSLDWSFDQLEGYFNSWSAVQKIKDEHGYNPVDSTMLKLREALPHNPTVTVTFPMFLRLGRI